MTAETVAPVLIGGRWRPGNGPARVRFTALDQTNGTELGTYPISDWSDIDAALAAGALAYRELTRVPPEWIATFLERIADEVERRADDLVALAHRETALPVSPRLAAIELPRATDQLRQAAAAVRDRSWREPHLNPAAGIASIRSPVPGVVVVFGPNNFPFAFNGLCGGDFASAIATGHPVIGKANRSHPGTTRLIAECVLAAAEATGIPPSVAQLLYGMGREDGERLVADPRVAATAFTGSRSAGLRLKEAADRAGRLIFLELSSVNPVVILPLAAQSRGEWIADQLAASMLSASGQFCTSPGILFVPEDAFVLIEGLTAGLERYGGSTLLSPSVRENLEAAVDTLVTCGAKIAWRESVAVERARFPTTLLRVDAPTFAANTALQTEAFGNAALIVTYRDTTELADCLESLQGNLTGSIYASPEGDDDDAYAAVEPILRERVGRLLNDKPPTGVAVVSSMVHGGPYPASGHPGFSAVGIPTSLVRYTMLQCYDQVADLRLPPELQAANPLGLERRVDGRWTRDPLGDSL